jgi:hypothetical protein
MPKITVTVSEEMEVPEGTRVVLAPTGIVSVLRLPDGTEIKPWLAYEKNPNGDSPEDVESPELYDLGVRIDSHDLLYDRTVEGDVEVLDHEGAPA